MYPFRVMVSLLPCYKVTPHFQGHTKKKLTVGLKYVFDAPTLNGSLKRVYISDQNNGRETYCLQVIKKLVVNSFFSST